MAGFDNLASSIEVYLLSSDAKFIEKCSLSREDLDSIVRTISDEDIALSRTTDTPGPTQLAVLFTFDAKCENGRPNVAVVSARSNPDPEWALLDVPVLDGDTEQVITFHHRLPVDFVEAILGV